MLVVTSLIVITNDDEFRLNWIMIRFPEYKKYENMNLIENEETTIDLTKLKVSYVSFEGLIDEFSF